MFQFENYPEIGERIFSYLDLKTLLNCSSVCKDWKQVLESPYFWLKKLNEVGHPSDKETAWKNLILKSTDFQVPRSHFAKCLQDKYKNFIFATKTTEMAREASLYHLKSPPALSAAYSGCLEIVKLISQIGEDTNRRIHWKNIFMPKYFEMPIFAAIKNGHTEVAIFIIETSEEKQRPSISYDGHSPIHYAIEMKNLDLVKYLVLRTQNVSSLCNTKNRYCLVHYAICDYRMFTYIMSLPGIEPNRKNFLELTPLHQLCDKSFMSRLKIPFEDVRKMIRVLAPLANPKYFYLHVAARHGSIEAIKALLEFFDANAQNSHGNLPIEEAIIHNQVEAVTTLAPFTKELKVRKSYYYLPKLEALRVMQDLIDERQIPCNSNKKARVEESTSGF